MEAVRREHARLITGGHVPAIGVARSRAPMQAELRTPDGLTISAQEWGNPTGPEILFIHGFSQSNLSWMRQVNSDLAKEFRMITYDLRGHGILTSLSMPRAIATPRPGATRCRP